MSVSSRVIDGLKTNTLYTFYVRAKNTMGQWSDLSDVVSRTTLKDTTAPSVVASPTLVVAPGMFLLNWVQGSNVDLRGGGYRIYIYTANTPASAVLIKEVGYTSEWAILGVGDASNNASITIAAGTTYYFWVTALDASANESAKVATTPTSGAIVGTYTATAHAASHENAGGDEISIAGLSGELADPQIPKITDRGDPAAWDWQVGALTTNGAWQTLDCSAIVPEGAKFINFRIYLQDDVAGSTFLMRENGNAYAYNCGSLLTQVANVVIDSMFIVACDSNRVIQYNATNTTWTDINILVRGWIF